MKPRLSTLLLMLVINLSLLSGAALAQEEPPDPAEPIIVRVAPGQSSVTVPIILQSDTLSMTVNVVLQIHDATGPTESEPDASVTPTPTRRPTRTSTPSASTSSDGDEAPTCEEALDFRRGATSLQWDRYRSEMVGQSVVQRTLHFEDAGTGLMGIGTYIAARDGQCRVTLHGVEREFAAGLNRGERLQVTGTIADTDEFLGAFSYEIDFSDISVMDEEQEESEAAVESDEMEDAAAHVAVGTHLVGVDIEPGLYIGFADNTTFGSCYWERLSGLSGDFDDILSNGNGEGQFYVQVLEGDLALKTDCPLTPLGAAPVPETDNATELAPGTYLVGRDIQPGRFRGRAGSGIGDSCYWERLSDLTGDFEGLLANDNAEGSFFVEVLETDFALTTGCEMTRVE